MFLFLPIIVGCPTTYKAQAEQQAPRLCPKCHNGSVIAAKRTTWFELFFIPIFPISRMNVWTCHICNWHSELNAGEDPPTVVYNSHPPAYGTEGESWQHADQIGYQPPYPSGSQQKAR